MYPKIAAIIPDRGDRPEFLQNCFRMMANQTMPPEIFLINQKSPMKENEKDITWRYRTGYDQIRGKGFECVFFVENDDYYHPQFIETMYKAWIMHNKPQVFGPNYTYYYNIVQRLCVKLTHLRRSTMASTMMLPDLNFNWPVDTDPYTDSWIWTRAKLRGITWCPENQIFIGIKHGFGLTGGQFHTDKIEYYNQHGFSDTELKWLSQNMDQQSFNFYSRLIK